MLDNLRLGAWTKRGTSQRDLARVFESFPLLYERRSQRAGRLSGRKQQMLALGRAMMAKPRLLLLDEPSLGLAPPAVREIFDTLRLMNETGTTIVVVERNAVLHSESRESVRARGGAHRTRRRRGGCRCERVGAEVDT